jgi:hypothetical protein
MDKHVTLVGVLNIVYRSVVILGAAVLALLAMAFGRLFDALMRTGSIVPDEVPAGLLDIIPIVLLIVAAVMVLVSVVGILGAVGVLKHKEWARILLLVISFFSLLRIPLGTILGIYSIWVLLNDETIRLFAPVPAAPASNTTR